MDANALLQEIKLKAIRSGGSGGQHVNKVATKVELTFDVAGSKVLTSKEKERIIHQLAPRLTKDHVLILQAEATRSQYRNKELAIKRFLRLLENALRIEKKRKKTKPSKSSIEKRLDKKKRDALKKKSRRRPELE
ncbi:alternative ribosome rescue aminoacyl-tRNA hydrolase ArfB [Maribacter polysaccharolyticus]|uniref:alternative ribosome rescue aminoacyl-tRNA hydrolase ArfB n=1 Tax=Maribacter polysaccharolyticus TaxID=3020831 RepID=UPI00237F9075|nr:alternative ribosome rescue aminoacyl-tRNA hydrolase ArfB [Maribacter polysaccharolyticus]MDE3743231.1 alternative ribosome rescue aminoacyl-tRNA hydrolase ArfB [Maribacter polysaccharolyticus]